ncbi:acyl-CoA thioesterase [Nocardia sp. NPDC060220]|uniref:acyl-CoA thioesterase n=1 Tax=Nocardia sp. NPDC060220 TaxID=3347076 RepID=UPI00365A48C8
MAGPAASWNTIVALRARDLDYLGHVTSSVYLGLLEEARVEWLSPAFPEDRKPTYVVAKQEITFHREILPIDGPVRISIRAEVVDETRYRVFEQISGNTGHLHASSIALLVAWDRDRRRPRQLSTAEREFVSRHPTDCADRRSASS